MSFKRSLYTTLIGLSLTGLNIAAHAQSMIKGDVVDDANKSMMSNVEIRNVHTKQKLESSEKGLFAIEVNSGDLIELHKKGYETLRIRIVNEKLPSYYKLVLVKSKENEVRDVYGHLLDYQKDSMRFEETYGHIINSERKGDIGFQEMPLAMLSRKNREKWAFQAMFAKWQDEKYVDFVFNKELVKELTHLDEEELKQFMQLYRPSSNFIRTSTRYEFLEYIKESFYEFHSNRY